LISEAGSYSLWVDGSTVAIRFIAAEASKNQLFFAAGLSAVAAVLLIVFAVLVYRGHGSWKKRAEKVAMPVFSVGTIALEVWDVYGDYFSYRTFLDRLNLAATAWMEQLMLPYTIFFGLSCVVALMSIGLKLKIFVGFVARMLGWAASVRLDHEQERVDLKKKMAALLLVALGEDLPMGIFGAYSFYRSIAECLGKGPACANLTSGAVIFSSSLTSFLMLGLKVGQGYRIYTKIQELEKYSAFYHQVIVAYGGDEAHRLKELANGPVGAAVPVPSAHMHHLPSPASNHPVHHEPEFVGVPPPQPPQPVEIRADGPLAPAGLEPEFAVAPAALLPAIASGISRAPAPGAFRGECPACKEGVYTTDEGRVREGDSYYHEGCVKGACSKCGENVYGDQARGHENGAYFHLECPPRA
jgi:uncharacterized protein with PQ loop repeat